ncbi:beta-lactamase [Stereum hirsutum FP-91666 SS1]|uniref:beta-lactamase n=1 Tax=Stereum hirsutum (strain FP-91666) TaxID=721885 RepID=UPI0004449CD4|nr:beta-lactamase [Stereum hirsutum FP-91666 SS1]EIM80588.1 beta-lactamase [Stereum hirsutum FP-91666 SS1]
MSFQLLPSVSGAVVKDTLRWGSAQDVGLDPFYVGAFADVAIVNTTFYEGSNHSIMPGAVTLAVQDGVVVSHQATGYAYKYADYNGTYLPWWEMIPMTRDTIFDLASLTKMFTGTVAGTLMDEGLLTLNASAASYVPLFASNGKGKHNITILNLFTHTSGLLPDPVPDLWTNYSSIEERIEAFLTTTPEAPPNTEYVYSDINFMTLGHICEVLTNKTLDALIRERITEPLGMSSTRFNPPEEWKSKIAPTEYQYGLPDGVGELEPRRPQPVWGSVHDENAWALGGVSGHAGLFSTAYDLAIFSQMILNNGTYGGKRILQPETVDKFFYNYNTAFPGDDHGLAWEINQYYWGGLLATNQTIGHTGYTGTSIAIKRDTNTIAILLTNRVHPNRNWGSNNPAREAVGTMLAHSLGIF